MDLVKEVAMKIPEVYKDGLDQIHFNRVQFVKWIGESLYHALVCAVVGLTAMHYNVGGFHSTGIYYTGTIVHLSITVVTNIRLMLIIRNWTWLVFFFYAGTFASWFVFMALFGSTSALTVMITLASVNSVGMQDKVLANPATWLCVLVSTAFCLLPALTSLAYGTFYKTRVSTMCMELQAKHTKALGLNMGALIGCNEDKAAAYEVTKEFGAGPDGKVIEMTPSGNDKDRASSV